MRICRAGTARQHNRDLSSVNRKSLYAVSYKYSADLVSTVWSDWFFFINHEDAGMGPHSISPVPFNYSPHSDGLCPLPAGSR